jgi:hypothetical protein
MDWKFLLLGIAVLQGVPNIAAKKDIAVSAVLDRKNFKSEELVYIKVLLTNNGTKDILVPRKFPNGAGIYPSVRVAYKAANGRTVYGSAAEGWPVPRQLPEDLPSSETILLEPGAIYGQTVVTDVPAAGCYRMTILFFGWNDNESKRRTDMFVLGDLASPEYQICVAQHRKGIRP